MTTCDTSSPVPAVPEAQAGPSLPNAELLAFGGMAALALAGCGGGSPAERLEVGTSNFPSTQAEAARFLGQASLEANTQSIESVMALGYDAWMSEQMAMPLSQSCNDWLLERNLQRRDTTIPNVNRFGDGGWTGMMWSRLFASPDVMRQRMVLAWSELFVVSFPQTNIGYINFLSAGYLDTLERLAFGNFRELLEAITLNVGMGAFLNMKGNQKADPSRNRVPDENYAREVMQLFTIGLHELNADGSLKIDGNGNPLETYTNDDTSGLAAALTGWDAAQDVGVPAETYQYGHAREAYNFQRPMVLDENKHSTVEKRFLGVTIPAGTKGKESLKIALDTLFQHPNTGPFVAKFFIQRLVTSNPSGEYVRRVGARFADNGQGVRGDMSTVIKAVLLDPEARQTPTSTTSGKLREPMIRIIQWARTFGSYSYWNYDLGYTHGDTSLGQMPLNAPSVFNFFRPGYVPPNTSLADERLVAPEFQILTEPTIVSYINYLVEIVNNTQNVRVNYSAHRASAHDVSGMVDRFNLWLAAGQLSEATLVNIKQAVQSIALPSSGSQDTALNNRIKTAIVLIMSCPEYLIQK